MSERFYIEGHKSKKSIEDENTLIFDRDGSYGTLEEATKKAREYFGEQKDLGLAVIYKEGPSGIREGIKFIYKDEEGKLEESSHWW